MQQMTVAETRSLVMTIRSSQSAITQMSASVVALPFGRSRVWTASDPKDTSNAASCCGS
jgi:hypothetical protein